ncbi:Rad4 beta-hairpin domain 1 [Penicillium concentricum]|uniref:Rad4 beta-hairpin domain 1 n=1 Tax=Penicillium concentricum TaxID=293559 RepID=A0A9W9SCV0_9EURO|nr:Rad4 beta-hairpin domain 1 [Penicillium concentricum]KAJ5375660.1 Rad4 beta-hairpin domain 1 [Penicillium concentricum]
MPPFVPRKRVSSEDPPPAKRQARPDNSQAPQAPRAPFHLSDSDSNSSLSDAPEDLQGNESEESEDEEDDIDWEDAIDTKTTATTPTVAAPELQDLELTLDQNETHVSDLLDGKKGPSKIERQIRIQTHCMHVQCLLFHNAIRNAWSNDSKVHEILRKKLPEGIHKEVKKWRIASGLELPEAKPEPPKIKKKGKKAQKNKDWSDESERLEPGQPDMSRGDPIITLIKVLVAYWRKQFHITAPGLRKNGYRPVSALEAAITDFREEEHDSERHGERIANLDEFRATAERMQGSRDVGAQLFTALVRALGIEARLVGSLQPLGFGWTKGETYTPVTPSKDPEKEGESQGSEPDTDVTENKLPVKNKRKDFDSDLPFPIYWTEVASPVTNEIISVDPLVLSNPVAPFADTDLQANFEPRGAKADRAKQVICYVVAHSSDGTAKEVTTRYLRRRTWPGKTKGFRMPLEKVPVGPRGNYIAFDWFGMVMRGYQRARKCKTAVDKLEETRDLQPNQPEKKKTTQTVDTLQSLRTSTEFVLERFLRREEALRPGAEPVRTFIAGKGARAKEEPVFRRADVLKCLSAESWHKEGRQTKPGAVALKRVPIRAVTLIRKREVDEMHRQTGEKPLQGLYARDQTEYIVPPPIQDGRIPKNEYGNIDCFVPSMVPAGAVHVPLPGTVRVCKKLGIDYAEAVTGFEFGSKMAVPVIQGVVVAAENEGLLRDAWRVEAAEKRKREELKAEKKILQTWRKFLFGLRIMERVRDEYGGGDPDADRERESHNPFAVQKKKQEEESNDDGADKEMPDLEPSYNAFDHGGGFLLPGHEDDADDGLVVENHDQQRSHAGPSQTDVDDADDSKPFESGCPTDSPPMSISSDSDNEVDNGKGEDSEPEYAPRPTRRTRGR